jgi:hypothetical protein
MSGRTEKGGGICHGIEPLACENPLPPIPAAIAAAQAEVAHGNDYTAAHRHCPTGRQRSPRGRPVGPVVSRR